ncbi:MAG: hypothetical protein ACP5KL_03490 [Thermoplasmata archaeon]
MEEGEPFVLYVSKRFLDKASKAYGLGLLVRKPLLDILMKMNVNCRELERDEARAALERLSESMGSKVSTGEILKNLAIAFFVPTGIIFASLKKVYYRSGMETDEAIILEFLAEIPRAFRTTLFYDIWLVVPKTAEGGRRIKGIIKEIVSRTGATPLTEEEWEIARPIVEKLRGGLQVNGISENLWTTF